MPLGGSLPGVGRLLLPSELDCTGRNRDASANPVLTQWQMASLGFAGTGMISPRRRIQWLPVDTDGLPSKFAWVTQWVSQ
jgi:hypothetical protein